MTDKEMELLPCPVSWCIDPRPQKFTSGNLHYIRCNECETKTPIFYSSTQAIAAWNTRSTSLAAQDGLDWKEAHENLLAVRQQDIAALQSKIESLEAQLKFKVEAINLIKGCPGKVVVRDGFYVLDCYKKKHKAALSAIKGDKS
jgi:hypothetical protein